MKRLKRTSIIRTRTIPRASSAAVAKTMKGNKSSNTKPEIHLRKALISAGLIGYRLNWSKVEGRPDIAYPGKRVAVFVQGCFWHSCPRCRISVPKKHRAYWLKKLTNNKLRDRQVQQRLKKQGWRTIIVWECQIKKKLDKIIDRLGKELRVAELRPTTK